LKLLWKIEKTIKRNTDQAAQKQNRPAACSAASSWARGPTANGQAAELARRGIPSLARMGRLPAQEARRDLDRRS